MTIQRVCIQKLIHSRTVSAGQRDRLVCVDIAQCPMKNQFHIGRTIDVGIELIRVSASYKFKRASVDIDTPVV